MGGAEGAPAGDGLATVACVVPVGGTPLGVADGINVCVAVAVVVGVTVGVRVGCRVCTATTASGSDVGVNGVIEHAAAHHNTVT
jgi:hypothetical protein